MQECDGPAFCPRRAQTRNPSKLYGYYDNPGRFLIRIEYSHARDRRVEEWNPVHDGSSYGGGDVGLCRRFHERIARRDCRGNRSAIDLVREFGLELLDDYFARMEKANAANRR